MRITLKFLNVSWLAIYLIMITPKIKVKPLFMR